jgi:hypothetical protein
LSNIALPRRIDSFEGAWAARSQQALEIGEQLHIAALASGKVRQALRRRSGDAIGVVFQFIGEQIVCHTQLNVIGLTGKNPNRLVLGLSTVTLVVQIAVQDQIRECFDRAQPKDGSGDAKGQIFAVGKIRLLDAAVARSIGPARNHKLGVNPTVGLAV